jgi:ribosome-associated protein
VTPAFGVAPVGRAAERIRSAGDLVIAASPGLAGGLTIPASELVERFSRSSGPGGQSVNTTDSRVELRFDVASSSALTALQRERALAALAGRLNDGVVSIVAAEQRSQTQNRIAARSRLVSYLREAVEPPGPPRRATRPSRAARQRRLDVKKQRSSVKTNRARPDHDA